MSTTTTTSTPTRGATLAEAKAALQTLRPFIGHRQLYTVADLMRGEEKQFFFDKVVELAGYVQRMPATYETDGRGEKAVCWLHYFAGGCASWWITEKDAGSPDDPPEVRGQQLQAFGLADLFQDGGELGYISIAEILEAGGELDFHFTPKPLADVRKERGA